MACLQRTGLWHGRSLTAMSHPLKRSRSERTSIENSCFSTQQTQKSSWSNSQITIEIRRSSALRFRFFEAKEVKVAVQVTGNHITSIGKHATKRRAIAGESGERHSDFGIPHPYGFVQGS